MESIDEIMKRIKRDFGNVKVVPDASFQPDADAMPGDLNCPICHGIGFIARDVPFGDPNFGKMDPCVCRQDEINVQQQKKTQVESNLVGYSDMTFDNYNVNGRGQLREDERFCLKLAREHAFKYANERNGWLLLTGPYGAGKTHLAAAIANETLKKGIRLIFLPVPDLLDWLRSAFGDLTDSFEDRFEQIKNIPLLILDDLGTQSSTPWASEKLFQIINYRYVHQLPTVITTNIDIRGMDGRIASRLEDPSLVTRIIISAPDYRNPVASSNESGNLSSLHLLQNRTFETFGNRQNEPLSEEARMELERALHNAKNFAQNPHGWLVFAGGNGSGKTHLAAAIGNYRRQHMENTLFVVVPDLLDHLRATFAPNATVAYDTMFESVRNAPLLILDHLNTAYATPWAKEKLYQILNYRYQAPLPTVITTVLPIKDIDPNIASRIVDFKVCTVSQMFNVPMYSLNPEISLDKSLPTRRRKSSSGSWQ